MPKFLITEASLMKIAINKRNLLKLKRLSVAHLNNKI